MWELSAWSKCCGLLKRVLRCMMRIALILRKMVQMSNEEALDEHTNLFHLRKGITLIIEKYKIKERHLYTVGSI